jgi:hypothetical protein
MSLHQGSEAWCGYADTIGPRPLDRLAVVDGRPSTMQQVRAHQESPRWQDGLVRRAVAWGWAAARVLVLDED